MTKKYNMVEFGVGAILLIAILGLGFTTFGDSPLLFRMIVGLVIGYALVRGAFGFAGSVNRAFNTGSSRLMRTLMGLFFGSAVLTAVLLYASGDATTYGLWINQINLGLILGGLMFGFGMAFCMCCASGVLTDLVEGTTRALVTLFFFGMGVFLGFPIQATQSFVTDTWFSSGTFESGVFLPDLFGGDNLIGYIGAVVLTGVFCVIVIYLARLYENKKRASGEFTGVGSEIAHDEIAKRDMELNHPESKEDYDLFYRLFIKPWSLGMAAVVIGGAYLSLMIVTKGGWGASTPYGYWFGRLLTVFGVSAESLAEFTKQSPESFTAPFFQNAMNVQNVCIIMGALIAVLLAGKFAVTIKEGIKITKKEILIFVVGGILMGVGTRLGNGCNVGALYTPIANLSLSGWIYLIFLTLGGVAGNMAKRKILK